MKKYSRYFMVGEVDALNSNLTFQMTPRQSSELNIEKYLAEYEYETEAFAKFHSLTGLEIRIYDNEHNLTGVAAIPSNSIDNRPGFELYKQFYFLNFEKESYIFDHNNLAKCTNKKVLGLILNQKRHLFGITNITNDGIFIATDKMYYKKRITYPKPEYEAQIMELYKAKQYDLIIAISSEAFQFY